MSNIPKDKVTPEIQKIIDKTQKDMDEIGVQQRFGYFSIPANNTITDRFYSREKNFNHKIIEGKVVTEKRGIFTQPPKVGKGHDAYFQSLDTTDQGVQQRLHEGNIKDHKTLMNKVKERKEIKFTPPFKYPGVQHYKDDFDKHPFKRDYPLTKEPEKHYKVVDNKVIIEPRGIYTQPMKKGLYNTPDILFSFTPLGHDKTEKFDFAKIKKEQKKLKRCNSAFPVQIAYKKPFYPASLKKNECFSNIKDTFGLENNFYKTLEGEANKVRHRPKSKYTKYIPSGSASHLRPFSPSSNSKEGRDGLFNKDIWNCPSIPEKIVIVNQREKREYEKAHRKEPFHFNRLQNPSTFSPSIATSQVNMKSEFPTVYKY